MVGDAVDILIESGWNNEPRYIFVISGKFAIPLATYSSDKARIASRLRSFFPNAKKFSALEVTGVYRRSVELNKKTEDPRNKSHSYYDSLCDEVKKAGNYYIVEAAGLVRPA